MLFLLDHRAYPASSIQLASDNSGILPRISRCVADPAAIVLLKEIFIDHYCNFFDKEFSKHVISNSFNILSSSQASGTDIPKLKDAMTKVSKLFYSKNDNSIFSKKYVLYKKLLKPKYYFEMTEKNFLGKRILDFGCGKGHFSNYSYSHGYTAIDADVLDYNEVHRQEIPFVQLRTTSDISKKIDTVDTTVCLTVLHHIEKEKIGDVLSKISLISRRLIVIEDVIDIETFKDKGITKLEKKMASLPEESRSCAVVLADFYGNVVAQGLSKMSLPFNFRTSGEWEKLLIKNGYSIKSVTPIGFPSVSFHGFFQVKIVCDSNNLIKETTSMA
ncbi:MAG: hypothetical protein COY80_02035 [Candidatus Pacebacteria bacterium CG_4_10_14_0_8_um_filter_42_14]|nr:MAG: hypothetical protein COY80_02035 [Candidatus Pacebacteria bacterium CG_4_10_14_0_8_um_filter_42_14]